MRTILNLENDQLTVAELIKRTKELSEPVGLGLADDVEVVMLLVPTQEYEQIATWLESDKVLPTRARKSPLEYFVEIVQDLRDLEERYSMSSADFYRRFQEGLIQEGPLDYFEWRVRYGSFLKMKARFNFSEDEVERVER